MGEAGEATPVWEPGDVVLGLYEVLDVVHSGGMGLVHRVRHLGWQVDLAVKTPLPELVLTPDGRSRFETEAGTWVGLGLHPHTVNCVYVRTVDGAPRVFAEWVDGGSLAQAVRSRNFYEGGHRAALGRILDTAIQMAWGLEYAHAGGLVHQDVKPANVMLEPDGTAKVTDFGLAGARPADWDLTAQRPREDPLTVSFGGFLTREYCSPEQAAAAKGHRTTRLTTATDVWSWAVSVLEMFTGDLPTRYGQLAGEVLENFLRNGGADDARVPAIPPTVVALLRQCFAKDPADRPSGLGEPAATLRDVYREALGTDHRRPVPKAAQLLSDGLSNQALSLLDLGRTEEAEELWRRAVAADPHRLPTVYNFGLHRWRSGQCTGEEVVSDLEAARTADTDAPAGLGALLLGSVQLERHENERAGELLREAVAADPDSADAAAALAEWERRPPPIRADLDGRTGQMSAVAVSADGDRVLAGDRAGGLLLWTQGERHRRRVRRTLTRRGLRVNVVAMDAAGALGVTVRQGGIVELWDLDRARRGVKLPHGDGGPAVRAAVSGDGRYVATGHQDGLIRVWESERGQLVTAWQGHLGTITSLALSRDGGRALSASFGDLGRDGTVRTWDVAGRHCVATLTGPMRGTLYGEPVHTSPMDLAAVSPDARCAVVAWWDGPLTLWDARRGTVVSEVPHQLRDLSSMAVATAGPVFLTVQDWGDPTQVWHAPTGRCLRTLDPHDGQVNATAVSADGHVAVLAGQGWSRSGQLGQVTVRSMPAPDHHAPWCYARPRPARELTTAADVFGELMDRADDLTEQGRFAPAAEVLRSAQEVPGFARHPRLRAAWAEAGAHGRRSTMFGAWPLYTYDGHGELTQPTTLALREDGAIAATGRWTGEVDVWDFPGGERLHTFDRGEGGSARDIQFALQGRLLAVRTSAGTIRQLSLEDGSKRLFTDETGPASTFALTPAGDRILIGDETGTLCLRNLPAGQNLRTLRAHGGKVGAVALSSDGRYTASHGGTHAQANHFGSPRDENEVHLWTPDSDRPAWTLTSRPRDEQLDFSTDGRTLFLSSNMFVTAWDVATGTLRYSIRTMGTFIGSSLDHPIVVFSADGRRAASPGDKALNVWETATGQVLHSLPLPLPGLFRSFALSADATFAVTGGTDRLVRVWEVSSGRCLRTLDGHRTDVTHTLLSRNGALLATADLGSGLSAWELAWDFDFPSVDGG